MAGDSGTSFPVAGLAVVALFLSTAFLAPRGFDLLRQVEDDAGRERDVEARNRQRERRVGMREAPRRGDGHRAEQHGDGPRQHQRPWIPHDARRGRRHGRVGREPVAGWPAADAGDPGGGPGATGQVSLGQQLPVAVLHHAAGDTERTR